MKKNNIHVKRVIQRCGCDAILPLTLVYIFYIILHGHLSPGGTAPIFTWTELNPASFFVDPIPQALTLTSIVIGACVTAMSLALVIKLEEQYGTTDTREIRRLRG